MKLGLERSTDQSCGRSIRDDPNERFVDKRILSRQTSKSADEVVLQECREEEHQEYDANDFSHEKTFGYS